MINDKWWNDESLKALTKGHSIGHWQIKTHRQHHKVEENNGSFCLPPPKRAIPAVKRAISLLNFTKSPPNFVLS